MLHYQWEIGGGVYRISGTWLGFWRCLRPIVSGFLELWVTRWKFAFNPPPSTVTKIHPNLRHLLASSECLTYTKTWCAIKKWSRYQSFLSPWSLFPGCKYQFGNDPRPNGLKGQTHTSLTFYPILFVYCGKKLNKKTHAARLPHLAIIADSVGCHLGFLPSTQKIWGHLARIRVSEESLFSLKSLEAGCSGG